MLTLACHRRGVLAVFLGIATVRSRPAPARANIILAAITSTWC